jgi:hypothetical protein
VAWRWRATDGERFIVAAARHVGLIPVKAARAVIGGARRNRVRLIVGSRGRS